MKLLNIAAALAPALAATLLCCAPAFAQDKPAQDKFGEDKNKVEFARVQEECVQSAEITFGPQGRWQSCTVTRAGFVATIGLQDFYYAHYCLGPTAAGCKHQAQVVFRNRAYRPEAFVEMVRIDPPGTRYDIPLLIGSDTEGALATGVRFPGKRNIERSYFYRAQDSWEPMDARAWLKDLQARLPAGLSARVVRAQSVLPDPTTMAVRLPLYRAADRDCCATGGAAEVQLSLDGGAFRILDMKLARAAK